MIIDVEFRTRLKNTAGCPFEGSIKPSKSIEISHSSKSVDVVKFKNVKHQVNFFTAKKTSRSFLSAKNRGHNVILVVITATQR